MNKLLKKAYLIVVFAIVSQATFAKTTLKDIEGAWLGSMNIPQGPTLRIGVEVFKKADNTWGGNIASLDQGARYMLVSGVNIKDNIFTLQMANAPINIKGHVSNDTKKIDAKFNQGNSSFDLILHKVATLPDTKRSQTPKKVVDYAEEEISFKNDVDNVWLSGTLTTPFGNQKRPAILLLSGSGPNHRDSYHAGHRTFSVVADHLTKLGYVVLRADKRGVYKSGGSFNDANIKNLVLDAQSAVQFLKSLKNVDSSNIVLLGHSEGSLVSIMTAQKEIVQGVISLAGPGMSVLDILLLQDQTEPAAKGATQKETDVLLQFSQRFYNMVLHTPSATERKNKALKLYQELEGDEAKIVTKWVNKKHGTLSINSAESDSFYEFLQQSPLPFWQKFTGKALILNGDKDSQVPAQENISGIVNAMKDQPKNVNSQIFEGLNHLFQPATTGSIDEYSQIEKTIDEQVLLTMSQWLKSNFKTTSSR